MSAGWRRWLLDGILSLLLGTGALIIYVMTLAPAVLAGDGGEFQFVPYLAGIAHPTGYPLYTILGWAWSHLLPLGDVAYRMNLFSAFWAALAVGLLYLTSRLFLLQAFSDLSPSIYRLLSALAAAVFAVTPTLWSQAVIAEVYGLQIFLVVLILYLSLSWGNHRLPATSPSPAGETERHPSTASSPQERGAPRRDIASPPLAGGNALLLAAAFFFGLGLAHHSTTLLLAPALLAYVWITDRRIFRDWRRVVLPALLLALLPLLLYLYIPLRAPFTGYLKLPLAEGRDLVLYENTLSNWIDFLLGGPFRGSLDMGVDLGARLSMSWGFLLSEVGWFGIALALLGVGRLLLARRWALLALTGLIYVLTVGFNLFYTIGDIYVLYIPAYLVVVLWLVTGVVALAALFKGRRLVSALIVCAFFLLPAWLAVDVYGQVDQSQNTRARDRWTAILAEPLPDDAVLVSNDRNNIMPLWYYQHVAGVRPDLLGLFPQITAEYAAFGPVLDLALSTDRPVYLVKEMPGIEIKVEIEPEDGLWRVLGPAAGDNPDRPLAASLADTVALLGADRSPRSPEPGETLQVSLYWQALRPLAAEYHTYLHLLDADGQIVAQSDQQPGGLYYATPDWQPGERLRDTHQLSVPMETPPGVYWLRAGMYAFDQAGALVPVGDAVDIGPVAVKTGTPSAPVDVGIPVAVDFDGQIELAGYRAERDGDGLSVTLVWHALQPPRDDYTVFVHLVDASGQTVAQHDGQPDSGAFPTSIWDEGEVVADEHALALPPGLVLDDHRLRIGLYALETGERLPLTGGGDNLELDLELED